MSLEILKFTFSYTVVELKAFGFLPADFNSNGYTVVELTGSFTISQLRIMVHILPINCLKQIFLLQRQKMEDTQ